MTLRTGLIGAALLCAVAACGDDGPFADVPPPMSVTGDPIGEPRPEPTLAPTGGLVVVEAVDNTFRAETIEVAPGTEVRWENRGRNEHDIVPVADGWGIEAGEFDPGDTYEHVFSTPGEYRYYCSLHGTETAGMVGTVVVSGA